MWESVHQFVKENLLFTIIGAIVVFIQAFKWMGNKYWDDFIELTKNKDKYITGEHLTKCREHVLNEMMESNRQVLSALDKHNDRMETRFKDIATSISTLDERNEERIVRVNQRIDETMRNQK